VEHVSPLKKTPSVPAHNDFQVSVIRAEDEAVDRNVLGNQRARPDDGDHLRHIFLRAGKGSEPLTKIRDQSVNGVRIDSPGSHLRFEVSGIDEGHAAIPVADDEDFLNAQKEYGNDQAADHAPVGVDQGVACVLDDLGVAALDSHRRFKKIHQPGIHAGEDGKLFLGIFGQGRERAGPDELFIRAQDRVHKLHRSLPLMLWQELTQRFV